MKLKERLKQKTVKYFKLFGYDFTFVIRHRFEVEKTPLENYALFTSGYQLGFWYKRHTCIGSKNFNNPTEWKNHYKYSHTIGFHGIWFKMWIHLSKGVMRFSIPND